MKKYKQEVVTNYVYDKTVCDICGRDIIKHTELYGESDTIKITHNHESFSYHGGSYKKEKEYDICAECFKKHITLLFREEPLHK
jgi:hypothetical protein